MKHTTQILFKLLRCGLGIEPAGAEFAGELSALSSADWHELVDVSYLHGVAAIAVDGMQKVYDAFPDTEFALDAPKMKLIRYKWFWSVVNEETNFSKRQDVANRLATLWAGNGISTTVLKGVSFARYYPVPSHRYSCDLDLFVGEDWQKACTVLEGQGTDICYEIYKDAQFHLDDVYVECHRYLMSIRGNDTLRRFELYLRSLLSAGTAADGVDAGVAVADGAAAGGVDADGATAIPVGVSATQSAPAAWVSCGEVHASGIDDSIPAGVSATPIPVSDVLNMPPLMFDALFCIEHARGHFLHERLTLRQICDWVMMRRHSVDWDEFHKRCEEFGLSRFACVFNSFADLIDGSTQYENLTSLERRVVDEMFSEVDTSSGGSVSFFVSRVRLFFDILKSGWKYREFNDVSMPVSLFRQVWTHFFDREVRL